MPPLLHVDRTEHRRRVVNARAITVAVVAALLIGVRAIVLSIVSPDTQTHAAGAWLFFLVGLVAVGGGWAVTAAWRHAAAARPHVLHVDATAAERRGVPELEAAPEPHRSLNGLEEPPRRW